MANFLFAAGDPDGADLARCVPPCVSAAEGLSSSIISLLGLTLRAPDHTALSRRSATLAVPRRSEEGDSTRFFSKNFGARMQGDVVKIPEGTPRSPKRAGGSLKDAARGGSLGRWCGSIPLNGRK